MTADLSYGLTPSQYKISKDDQHYRSNAFNTILHGLPYCPLTS